MAAGRYTLSDANIAQILATMTEHLGRMTDPSYGKKLREDLLTLPEEIQTATNKAQEIIERADSVKADIKKQTDFANEQLSVREKAIAQREKDLESVNILKAEVEAQAIKNSKKEAENRAESERLVDIAKQQEEINKKHNEAFKDIAKKQQEIADKHVILDKRKQDIEDYEREINETAQQMSGLVKSKIRK